MPADIAFNIFEDPEFEKASFMLSASSPCVDSGCGTVNCAAENFQDVCFPPSRGGILNDIGAYGGPWACHWQPSSPSPVGRVPGDCNEDGRLELSDAVCIFGVLFLGSPPTFPCGDGSENDPGNIVLLDWQPDGMVNISDGIALLEYLFRGGPPHHLAVAGNGREGRVEPEGCP